MKNAPAKPFKWTLVTGRDFARSIAWSKTQPTLSDFIRAKLGKKMA